MQGATQLIHPPLGSAPSMYWELIYFSGSINVNEQYQGFIERGGGGGWHWDFNPPGKVSPLQVLKNYYTCS